MLIIWVILTELKQWEIKLNYSNLMWVSFHLFYILNVWLLLFSVEVINSLCPCCCSKPLKPSSSSNKPLPFIKVIEIRSWENRRTWQPEAADFFPDWIQTAALLVTTSDRKENQSWAFPNCNFNSSSKAASRLNNVWRKQWSDQQHPLCICLMTVCKSAYVDMLVTQMCILCFCY